MPVDIILSRLHPPFLWQDFPHYPGIKTHAGHLINSGAFKRPPRLGGARIRKEVGRGVGLFYSWRTDPSGGRCPLKSRVPSSSYTRGHLQRQTDGHAGDEKAWHAGPQHLRFAQPVAYAAILSLYFVLVPRVNNQSEHRCGHCLHM